METNNERQTSDTGILYLCATPIGNLEDITLRVLRVLREEVDIIAAEDTRHTAQLLNHFAISKKLISYHEHNKIIATERCINILLSGENVALVSDAGMPAIADPGELLVKRAVEEGINVIPLPGANAALCALVASGMPTMPFTLIGFLPRKDGKKKKMLEEFSKVKHTLIFYEAPHRILKTIKIILEIFGNRQVVLGRELSKHYEEFLRMDLLDLSKYFAENEARGEMVLIVAGNDRIDNNINYGLDSDGAINNTILVNAVESLLADGMKKNEAIKHIANKFAINRQLVYNLFVKNE